MGPYRYIGQGSSYPFWSSENSRTQNGNDHSRLAREMESANVMLKHPKRKRIPTSMDYLRLFAIYTACITLPGRTELPKSYKLHKSNTMQVLLRTETEPQEMRFARLWPNTDSKTVWQNFQTTPVSEGTKSIWYRLIHAIISTNERLHRIRLAPTDRCRHCDKRDTIQNLFMECLDGTVTWEWTRQRIALMLRTDPST